MIAKYFEQFDEIISKADFITSLEIHKRWVFDENFQNILCYSIDVGDFCIVRQ